MLTVVGCIFQNALGSYGGRLRGCRGLASNVWLLQVRSATLVRDAV